MVKRVHNQTLRYSKQLSQQLLILINQSMLHGIKRESVMKRAQKIFERHADLLFPYVYRSRVKLQVGKTAKNLTAAEKAAVKQKTVEQYLKSFEALYDDYVKARLQLA